MKKRLFYTSIFLSLIISTFTLLFAFSIITDNSGYARRYPDATIPFIYKLNDTTPANYFDPIDSAAQTWEDVLSSYWEFENGGVTTISTDNYDGTNLVFFDIQGVNFPSPTNAIAYSRTWTSGTGLSYRALESDLVWNARDFPPSPTGSSGLQDLQSTMTHEFGHHLGLGHAGPAGGPPGVGPLITSATMYGFGSAGDTTGRSLHIDDIAGVSAIYPVWILEGVVSDGSSGLTMDGAKISSNIVFGLTVGPVIFGQTSQRAGYYENSLITEVDGSYSTVILLQNPELTAEYFGYQGPTISIPFNTPGGIGQTETITQDFQLLPSPVTTISGTVIDSINSTPLSARIKIFTTSNKPGIPDGALVDTVTNLTGSFSITVPSLEDYIVSVYPQSPYAGKEYSIDSLSSGGEVVQFKVNPADILLVDDDNGASYEEIYFEDFETIGKTYHHWDVQTAGAPSSADRNAYPDKIMFWFTGDGSSFPLTQTEHDEILDHVTTGGKLFLTGQDIAEMNSGSNLTTTLGIDYTQNSTLSLIMGVSNDVISNLLVFNVSGSGGANNQTSSDVIQITDLSTTTAIFHYGGGTSKPAAARYENGVSGSKAVFLGFGAESINDPSRRQTLLTRVIEYLGTPITSIDGELANGILPEKFELLQNYPNPFNPETTIKYSIREKSKVSMVLFNNLGQKVRTLVNKNMSAGQFAVSWNGLDDNGKKVPSGVYFYQMLTDKGFKNTKKLLLLK